MEHETGRTTTPTGTRTEDKRPEGSRDEAVEFESKVGMKLPFGSAPDTTSTPGDSILPGTSIVAITWQDNYRVYFQDKLGGIREGRYSDGEWAGGDSDSVLFTAKLYTPLAIITWDSGKQIRMYYLNEKNWLQEFSFTAGVGWYHGRLTELRIQVAHFSRIAAVWLADGPKMRVYIQGKRPSSNAIEEYAYNHSRFQAWAKENTLAVALRGSSIAAIRWGESITNISVFYQDSLLRVREYRVGDGGRSVWYDGNFGPIVAPPNTPITAIESTLQARTLWQDSSGDISELRYFDNRWQPKARKLMRTAGRQTCLYIVKLDGSLPDLRLYFQGSDNALFELAMQWD
ncbi:hypothetical protein FQN54_005184 [Arachnomyces sp. PD_36]|nr:hypothetical protein FQN54_005184 [Arachnomyces sp. PD_36]